MNKSYIINELGLVPDGLLMITDIQMVQWGRDLIFTCHYQTVPDNAPPDAPVYFNIIFHDCREIKYKIYAHIGVHEQGKVTEFADVVDISLGEGKHYRDANIMTNYFGVTLSYGRLEFERIHYS